MPSDILRAGKGTTDAIVAILGRLGLPSMVTIASVVNPFSAEPVTVRNNKLHEGYPNPRRHDANPVYK